MSEHSIFNDGCITAIDVSPVRLQQAYTRFSAIWTAFRAAPFLI